MPKIFFLVVEDHPKVAESNCQLLNRIEPEAYCIKVETPDQAREILAQQKPDLIVVDLQFPVVDLQFPKVNSEKPADPGLELLQYIFKQYPRLNILISSSEPSYLIRIKDGINHHEGGFVVSDKLDDAATYINRAKMAWAGENSLPKEIRREMPINKRELDVLKLLWHKCWKDEKIANELHIGKRTVQNYIKSMKDKLDICTIYGEDANDRVALCREAVKQHLV